MRLASYNNMASVTNIAIAEPSSSTRAPATRSSSSNTNTTTSSSLVRRIALGPLLFDCAVCAVITFLFCAIPPLAIHPYRRGFFCDDDSIRYPYKADTISVLLLGIILVFIVIFIIGGVEAYRLTRTTNDDGIVYRLKGLDLNRVFVRFWTYAAHCAFGVLFSTIVCQVTKYAVGRLRPHFLDVCKPNLNLTACSTTHQYIWEYECLGEPKSRVQGARLSFFSGHSSTSMCVAVFCVLYLQARLPRRVYGLSPLPVFQTLLITGALLVGYSRIDDNMHHWSDVLVGFLVGALAGIISAIHFGKLFKRRNAIYRSDEELPLIDVGVATVQPQPPYRQPQVQAQAQVQAQDRAQSRSRSQQQQSSEEIGQYQGSGNATPMMWYSSFNGQTLKNS